MTHPNAELLSNAYEAFERGDIDAAVADFTDDVMFNIPGSSPLAGEYKGKEQVIAYLRDMIDRSEGTFRLESHDVIASDSHVIGLTVHRGQRKGKSSGYNSVQVFHVDDGKLTEFWEFPDQPDFDDFWS